MDRSKRFTNFFHNFVVMKKSVNFLPEKKQSDLKQLVDLVRRNIKDVGMVILYGSYARNTYVDYDQRIEFGVPTYFMSDYDIVILTRKPIGAIQHSLYSKIKNQFFEDKNRPFHTKPQFINYGIDDYNYALTKGHYFETEINARELSCMIPENINWNVAVNWISTKLQKGRRNIMMINFQLPLNF